MAYRPSVLRAIFALSYRRLFDVSNGVALLGAVLVAWLCCATSLHRPYIGDFMDDGEYFVAAQSIRDGHGYRLLSRPTSPAEAKYPPGLSLIAAGLLPAEGRTVEADFRAARLVALVAGIVYSLASFATLRLLGVPGLAAAGCLVPALFGDVVLTESLTLLSDIPFAACCSLVALIWALLRTGRIAPNGWVALSLGIVAGASYTLRSNGVALCISCLAFTVVAPKRFRFAGVYILAVAFLPVLARALTPLAPGAAPSEPYSVNWIAYSSVQAGLAIWMRNVGSYIGVLPTLFVPVLNTNLLVRHPLVTSGIRIVVWLAVLRGVWLTRQHVRRVDLPPILFLAFTIAICVIWPWELYLRIAVPFMPFLIAVGLSGGDFFSNWRVPFKTLALGGVVVLTAAQATMIVRALRYPGHGLDEAFQFVRSQTEADAVIVTQLPETAFLYTGRQAIKLLGDSDLMSNHLGNWASIDAWRTLAQQRAFYLLGPPPAEGSTDLLTRHMTALAMNAPNRLEEVYRTSMGDYAVLRIVSSK